MKTLKTTLLIIKKDDKILLGEKKRGFAKGTLNGIGGKQDPGETNEQAMIRETQEEIGVTPVEYELMGTVHFDMYYKGEHSSLYMNIYSCTKYHGKPLETEEIIPAWYDINNIPYEKMLQDDKLWMPLFLKNQKFVGKVKFDKDMVMLYHDFQVVENLENTLDC
jgi:mutator protein MutT